MAMTWRWPRRKTRTTIRATTTRQRTARGGNSGARGGHPGASSIGDSGHQRCRARLGAGVDVRPAQLTTSVGTTLTWTNAGSENHTVTSDDRTTFDSRDLGPGHTSTPAISDQAPRSALRP